LFIQSVVVIRIAMECSGADYQIILNGLAQSRHHA
jgi:hypothetical protein